MNYPFLLTAFLPEMHSKTKWRTHAVVINSPQSRSTRCNFQRKTIRKFTSTPNVFTVPRDSMLARYMLSSCVTVSVRLSVRLSHAAIILWIEISQG